MLRRHMYVVWQIEVVKCCNIINKYAENIFIQYRVFYTQLFNFIFLFYNSICPAIYYMVVVMGLLKFYAEFLFTLALIKLVFFFQWECS